MIGFIVRATATIVGFELVRRKVTGWFSASEETVVIAPPRHEHLRQDALTGEFIPESQVIRRRINGMEYTFASIESYIRFRHQHQQDALKNEQTSSEGQSN